MALALLGAAHGQSLKGVITLSAQPKMPPAPQSRPRPGACGPHLANEALLVGKKLELANAVIFAANIKPEANLQRAFASLEMQNCAFTPHVLALVQGDTLLLRNTDRLLHDARGEFYAFRSGWDRVVTKDLFESQSRTAFNFVLPRPESAAHVALDQPGLIRVQSTGGHDWMQAHILVFPHRVFAVSNKKGEFALPRLPRGKYDLVLWHEYLGVQRQLLELQGTEGDLRLTWKIPEELLEPSMRPSGSDSAHATLKGDPPAGRE